MINNTEFKTEHPGFYIQEELDARGWSQADLSYILDMKPPQLNSIISGKTSISADMAMLLSAAFDIPAEFFADLQKQYDLDRAKRADPSIGDRAKWQSKYPLREMTKRKWLMDVDSSLLDAQMLRFFERNRIEDVPFFGNGSRIVAHSAKKTTYEAVSAEQIAWLHRVRHIAKDIKVPRYEKEKLDHAIEELSGLMSAPEDAPCAVEILRGAGVRLIFVETLPRAKIDGVCTWLDDQPVIALTLRFDRMDNYWHVLRHELEHARCGHGQEEGSMAIDTDETLTIDTQNNEEVVANKAASNFCVPISQMDSFLARKGNFVSEKDILGFSRRLAIHPSIAIGQYQYRTKKYNFLRKYLSQSVCGVRAHIIEKFGTSNIIDGWDITSAVEL